MRPLRDLWQRVKTTRINFPDDDARMKSVMNEVTPQMAKLRQQSREQTEKIYESSKTLGRHFHFKRILSAREQKERDAAERKAKAEAAKRKAEAEAKAKAGS